MTLTPEQKHAVAGWVAAGDNLSTVQKKLADTFKLSMTYMDVRFLVDDLNLALKDAAPKADASDVSKTPPRPPAEKTGEKKGLIDRAKEKLGLGGAGSRRLRTRRRLMKTNFRTTRVPFRTKRASVPAA